MHPMDRSRAVDRFEAVPRLAFGHYPTPLEKMPRLRAALGGGPALFIKRDDYTGAGLGGNKVRKLEYVLAAAQTDGVDSIITCGGEGSNHCRVTAMLAARLGLECTLVLNGGREGARKPASVAVEEMVGARIVRVESRGERNPAMERAAGELRGKGRRPLIIPVGASTPSVTSPPLRSWPLKWRRGSCGSTRFSSRVPREERMPGSPRARSFFCIRIPGSSESARTMLPRASRPR